MLWIPPERTAAAGMKPTPSSSSGCVRFEEDVQQRKRQPEQAGKHEAEEMETLTRKESAILIVRCRHGRHSEPAGGTSVPQL